MPGAAEVSVSEHLSKIPAAVRPTVKAARQRSLASGAIGISFHFLPPQGRQSSATALGSLAVSSVLPGSVLVPK